MFAHPDSTYASARNGLQAFQEQRLFPSPFSCLSLTKLFWTAHLTLSLPMTEEEAAATLFFQTSLRLKLFLSELFLFYLEESCDILV